MLTVGVPVWKKAPFLRLLLPLMTGITIQWYLQIAGGTLFSLFVVAFVAILANFLLHGFVLYKSTMINGIVTMILFIVVGCILTFLRDVRHQSSWFARYYETGDFVKITLEEPPIEKANSYKTVARVTALKKRNEIILATGKVIVYIAKDPSFSLQAGSEIIFSNSIQEIGNTGNPGGFDYKRHCLFLGITHQVFLTPGGFTVLQQTSQSLKGTILLPIQRRILSVLRRYIPGAKEYGLAEALLIGHKDDLDKDLVQSYTNTGVVHIIAISGMHIALIYWLLELLCRPLRKVKYSRWLVVSIILSGLWLFSLVAGGEASVLRSALMFTCIVIGNNLSKRTSIYNSLAMSAFILLCYNPFWLWDVGFQLSYAAVLSIVIFSKAIYNWLYVKNKFLDLIWKLNAVCLAAQLLTTPFSVYHFHQFPNFFLLTNFIAVPLSSLILLGEIFLCGIWFIPLLASLSGAILSRLIWLMNSYIERVETLPFSLWNGLQVSVLQSVLLLIIVASLGCYFAHKQKNGAWVALLSILFFVSLRSLSFRRSVNQQKIIVYNIPRHQAIDFIDGRNLIFIGDTDVLSNVSLRNFYLNPSRALHRARPAKMISSYFSQGNFIQFRSKKIVIIDRDYSYDRAEERVSLDLLIISKNPALDLLKLSDTFDIQQVVFDASVPPWKIRRWSKDCELLHIVHHDMEKGAFVMNLN